MQYLFLLVFIALLFLSHYGVYRFFLIVFNIELKRIKNIVGLVFIFLSFSFFVSLFILRAWETLAAKVVYIFSGIWLGFLVNFLVFFGLFGLFLLLYRFAWLNLNLLLIGRILFVCAILYSSFGIYNVFNPRIKNIDISINNLPENWQGKKIVQLSDVHLGRVLGKRFLGTVINKVKKINPDIIVITGDLFDGIDGNLEVFIDDLNELNAEKGVFYVTGNHEIYLGLSDALSAIEKTKIKYLNDEVVDVDGLQIVGISFPKFGETKDGKKIIEENENFDPEKPNILLYHSPTNIFANENNNGHGAIYFAPDVNFDAAKELGIDLQLSGHTHKGQIFPFNLVTRLIYGKYDYGLHEEDNFSIYTSSGTGVWGPTMRTSSRSEIVVLNLK